MYYFELFELPVSLIVNKAEVLKKYYQLSRQYHPDRFTLQGEDARSDSLDMSTRINEAKNILDDAGKRLAYILKEKNVIEPDEKYALSPLFLAEMMDINEQLMEMDTAEATEELKQKIRNEIAAIESELYADVKPYFEMSILDVSADDLAKLKDYYYKRKYLFRILDRLN